MEHRELHVLIVSTIGAHQKAIRAVCASLSQIVEIVTASNTPQAFEMIQINSPDLVILGANLSEGPVCEFLAQIETLPNPPYCIALTVSEFRSCFEQDMSSAQIIPTTTFAQRLPEILEQVPLQ